MTRYIGDRGGRADMSKIHKAARVLKDLPTVEMGLAYQCRCGSTKWVEYRGRFYSPCGIRMANPDILTVKNRVLTFREAFDVAKPQHPDAQEPPPPTPRTA